MVGFRGIEEPMSETEVRALFSPVWGGGEKGEGRLGGRDYHTAVCEPALKLVGRQFRRKYLRDQGTSRDSVEAFEMSMAAKRDQRTDLPWLKRFKDILIKGRKDIGGVKGPEAVL